jgi:molecular chaperone DnaK
MPIFGIDFGTNFCRLGVMHQDAIIVLQDECGQSMVPSIIHYPEQGAPIVGWDAREKLATSPSTTFLSPKRLIGRDYDDPSIQAYLKTTALNLKQGPLGEVMAEINGRPLSLVQVCAEIFFYVAELCRKQTGIEVKQVELATPIGFNEQQQQALIRAIEMAGLQVAGTVAEPIAAAAAFGALNPSNKLVAVYDFGGGTFDFTLLQTKGDKIEIIAEASDPSIGGDDLDVVIANYAAEQFESSSKIDLHQQPEGWRRLLMVCEEAKRQLSLQDEIILSAPAIANGRSGPLDLNVQLNRPLFEALCRNLVNRSIPIMDSRFELVGINQSQVDKVVIIGGITRIPLVQELIRQYFQKEIHQPLNPEYAVVHGAAQTACRKIAERNSSGTSSS